MKVGISLSIAVAGGVAAAIAGATGHAAEGLLAGFGFNALGKTINVGADDFLEGVSKAMAKSYQVDIFEFKKQYSGKIEE